MFTLFRFEDKDMYSYPFQIVWVSYVKQNYFLWLEKW